MFRSVRIQNFRQFKDLKLENLGRINLITGQNNTGKTSLLEAIWFLAAAPVDPGVVRTAARLRGIDHMGLDGPASWGWIFRDHRRSEGIVLEATREGGQPETLRIYRSDALRGDLLSTPRSASYTQAPMVSSADVSAESLRFEFVDGAGETHESALDIIGQDVIPRVSADVALRSWYFLSNRMGDPVKEAQNFDRLVLAGLEQEILGAYQTIDRRVTRVRTLDPGSGQRIYASLDNGTLLPVDVMGHGFYRMGKIATAILSARGGVALIDEIDDGLHYSAMADVWKVIIAAAHQYDVQLLVTTHSLECVKAAAGAAENVDAGLVLHRLSRRDGGVRATLVEDEGIRAAADFGFDLR